jgi:hypothetical protein
MEDTMKDEKMVKFETIAQKRVQNALHAISLIGNLANPSAYHYTPEHTQQIFDALEQAVALEKKKFEPKPQAKSFCFSNIKTPAPDTYDDEVDTDDEVEEAEEASEEPAGDAPSPASADTPATPAF